MGFRGSSSTRAALEGEILDLQPGTAQRGTAYQDNQGIGPQGLEPGSSQAVTEAAPDGVSVPEMAEPRGL